MYERINWIVYISLAARFAQPRKWHKLVNFFLALIVFKTGVNLFSAG